MPETLRLIVEGRDGSLHLGVISPQLFCNKHLLAEHWRIHSLVRRTSHGRQVGCSGFAESRMAFLRHEAIAEELIARGLTHNSPLPENALIHGQAETLAPSVVRATIVTLGENCADCQELRRLQPEEYHINVYGTGTSAIIPMRGTIS